MKIPNKIETLQDLAKWTETKRPKLIEIGKKGKLRKIREFNPIKPTSNIIPLLSGRIFGKTIRGVDYSWTLFQGIPIKYL